MRPSGTPTIVTMTRSRTVSPSTSARASVVVATQRAGVSGPSGSWYAASRRLSVTSGASWPTGSPAMPRRCCGIPIRSVQVDPDETAEPLAVDGADRVGQGADQPRMVGRVKKIPVPEALQSFAPAPRHLSLLAHQLFDGPMTVKRAGSPTPGRTDDGQRKLFVDTLLAYEAAVESEGEGEGGAQD